MGFAMAKASSDCGSKLTMYYPFRIKCNLPSLIVADDLVIQRMDDEEKKTLLHIENVEYDKEGRIKEFTFVQGDLLSLFGPSMDDYAEYYDSNYMLCAPSEERAEEFNLALKLCGHSTSSLYIGHGEGGTVHFISPPCYFGRSPLEITEGLAKNLSQILRNVASNRDNKKIQIMSEKYLYAVSRDIRKGSRFIELAIILEMILLPKASLELSYRFSLRMARLMSKLFGVKTEEAYKNAKRIYRTRSNLVHSGSDKHLEQVVPIALDYTRRLLCAYLEDKAIFGEASLDGMCLS